MNGPGAGDG
jgi:hypothetical protein